MPGHVAAGASRPPGRRVDGAEERIVPGQHARGEVGGSGVDGHARATGPSGDQPAVIEDAPCRGCGAVLPDPLAAVRAQAIGMTVVGAEVDPVAHNGGRDADGPVGGERPHAVAGCDVHAVQGVVDGRSEEDFSPGGDGVEHRVVVPHRAQRPKVLVGVVVGRAAPGRLGGMRAVDFPDDGQFFRVDLVRRASGAAVVAAIRRPIRVGGHRCLRGRGQVSSSINSRSSVSVSRTATVAGRAW